ncbi:hypothetical protein HID58_005717 [Brassica napus]|uniref:Uncharacterized protein n=1 Tax=Brassica napus TaxID=3708 RepID=A0ABQ8EC93_BRANA|nr:hypothetical protein HID58_005717 [Brassica napus]
MGYDFFRLVVPSSLVCTKKRVIRSGKKIAPPVSNKPRFNFIEETFVSAGGVKTKVWTLPAAEMHSVMNDSDSDSDSDGEPYPNFGVGVNPHESVLSNCDRAQQKISVGRNLGYVSSVSLCAYFTRRCKLNLLRKRGQILEHKLIKKPAPFVSRFNFIQDTFVSASGVKTKVWTLPLAEMDSVMNDSDSDSDSDGSHDLELYLKFTKRVMRSRKKITPPVSHKPFIAETFVTPCGIKTKVWRLPESALNGPVMDSALDEDSDESDGYLHRELGCGCNPHEPVLSNSSVPHIKNRIKVSLGYTRRCKLNVLRRRRRRQRLAHKLIKNRAPSVPSSNFIQETFVTPCGVKMKVWRLPESALNGPVMDSALNEEDEDESPDESDGILMERLGIGTQRSNPAIGGERAPLLSLLHTAVFDTSFRASNALVLCISDDAGAVPSMEQKELLFRSIATLLSKNGLSESADVPHSIGSK